jgi:ATP-dependent DNA helicase RecQ
MDATVSEPLRRVLSTLAGLQARPRPGQQQALDALVAGGGRVLVVQATGWGKSAVYWAATVAQREAGRGPTVVMSPLLALMRDQIEAASSVGLRAVTVNSSNVEDWNAVFEQLQRDEVDVLLVSPERLSNPAFEHRALPLLGRAGLLVIDEAHCISDWGHDFRPDYQRVAHLLARLDQRTPVLATTATANARVTADVAGQLGPDTLVLRGPLARQSLHLSVIPGLGPVERFAWVDEALESLPGSGIVYGLTVDATEVMAEFLASRGHAVAAYTGQTPAQERLVVEAELKANRLKAVVATSALGMGYDKPDLAFCIHVGSPGSPISYYQQVGRAGRALDTAVGVLVPAAESDPRVWEYFATANLPDRASALAVQTLLRNSPVPLTTLQIETATGLKRGRLGVLLKVLHVEGAVTRTELGWAVTGNEWLPDEHKYSEVVAARRAEADLMRSYASGRACLMQVLTSALDDPHTGPCGRCSVCTGVLPPPGRRPSRDAVVAAAEFLRGRDHPVEPRRRWPAGVLRSGRITGYEAAQAIAFADDPVWPDLVRELSGPDAPPSEKLIGAVKALSGRLQAQHGPFAAVIPVDSRTHPVRVLGMAQAAAAAVGAPVLHALTAQGGQPDHDVASAELVQALELGLVLDKTMPVPAAPVLLVDDVTATRWTLTVAATLLREAGSTAVYGLVGHKTPG